MIESLTANESLTTRGNYKPNIHGVCCKFQVPHPQIGRKNEGLTSVPLLSRVGLVPHAQLRKKFEGQPSIPLLSRSQAYTLVPNSTPICKHMRETLGVLTQCLQKIFLVFGGMLEKKYQLKNQKKFFCSWTSQDSPSHSELNHRRIGGLSLPAAKQIFSRQQSTTIQAVAFLQAIQPTRAASIKKFPRFALDANRNNVRQLQQHCKLLGTLHCLTVLYQPGEVIGHLIR